MYIKYDPQHRIRFELGEVEFDFTKPNVCHGGKSGGGTNTVTQNSSPPPQIMAAYQTALNSAQSAASQPLQQYGGPTVAGFTPDQTAAFGTIDQAQGSAQPYINQAQGLIQQGTQPLWNGVQQFSPQNVQQYMSPYTGQVLNSAVAQQQNTDAQQQQALKGNAISSGAFGGDRAGVASAVLSGQQDIANNSTNANILNQAYTQGLGEFNTQQQAQLGANEANSYLNQQGAFGLANLGNEALSSQLTGASAQLQSGALQQQLGQEALNIPYEQFQQQQAYPFQTAQYFSNIAEGLGSGSGGTSSTTSPSASNTSQLLGLGIGGLSLAGQLGAFGSTAATAGAGDVAASSAADLFPLVFAKRGGAIKSYDSGGSVLPPDLSISFVPSSQMQRGMGPPKSPPVQQTPSTADQVNQAMGLMKSISGLGNYFSGSDSAPSGFDDGGQVGGQTPLTSQYSSQQQPTYGSSYNNMTPEQLQQLIMRLPMGSQQQKQATAILQQKRMMPNVGAQAVGGFGSQSAQQPMQQASPQPTFARGGFADGGDTDLPVPPTPDQLQRVFDLGDLPAAQGNSFLGNGPPAPPITGAMGTKQMTASASPPPSSSYYADEEPPNSRTPAKANPWLALAAAGFGMAAGTSPQAGVNIGRGALEGLSNYAQQQREADTVNDAADKLMAEAKQHKDQIAMEQEQRDLQRQQISQQGQYQSSEAQNSAARIAEEARHNQVLEGQGKNIVVPGLMGSQIYNSSTGKFVTPPGMEGTPSTDGSPGVSPNNIYTAPKGSDGAALTGDAYLATIPPQIAQLAKSYQSGAMPPPTGFALKNPMILAAWTAAQNADPENAAMMGTRYQTLQDFTHGQSKKIVASQNVGMEHLSTLSGAINALDNGDIPAFNKATQALAQQTGSPVPTNFELGKAFVSDELAKAVLGTTGAAVDRDKIASNLSVGSSNDQAHGFINTAGQYMAGQAYGQEKAYTAGTGLKDYRDRFMTPKSQALIDQYYPQPAPSPDARKPGKTIWHSPKGPLVWTVEGDQSGWAPVGGP